MSLVRGSGIESHYLPSRLILTYHIDKNRIELLKKKN